MVSDPAKISGALRFAFKLKTAAKLALAPMFTILVFCLVIGIFTQLNLAFFENLGKVISASARDEYYARVAAAFINEIPSIFGLTLAVFIIGFILANWALSAFASAERYVRRRCLAESGSEFNFDFVVSESPRFEGLVRDFADRVAAGLAPEFKGIRPRTNQYWRFYAEFIFIFTIVLALQAIVFSIVANRLMDEITEIGLQLVGGRNIQIFYFDTQHHILNNLLNFSVFLNLLLYLRVGWSLRRKLVRNDRLFIRAIMEERFPLPLPGGQPLAGLAQALSSAHALHRQRRN